MGLSEEIKRANRLVYDGMSPDEYNRNESIFNERRRAACSGILAAAAARSGGEAYLDVGTGTGNLLRISQKYFRRSFGTDISGKLLASVREDFPGCHLSASDAEMLPFKDCSFNCVSCYALLHHLLEHQTLIQECFRVLKPGGTLYTDHDPNYFFNRFYHLFYRLRFAGRHGFGSDAGDLAEYHNVFSPGINPERLRGQMLQAGFREVNVSYRLTDNENLGRARNLAISAMKAVNSAFPGAKSFYTHFSVVALK